MSTDGPDPAVRDRIRGEIALLSRMIRDNPDLPVFRRHLCERVRGLAAQGAALARGCPEGEAAAAGRAARDRYAAARSLAGVLAECAQTCAVPARDARDGDGAAA